ncbi:hypothetical protein HHS34_005525 [Acidithiobacillus montserratensis]|uniref:Uncharacterized protein n=1 Tax=Acidithiobacillus montserratensis TaxID=2729135 RepID=A0ACD5HJ19_9PROT|nr:hypothetical protein [Acidithiobacillus montserratensis]MBU2747862.1 hypothetical protein [Acidithiobacillus montserratensis]
MSNLFLLGSGGAAFWFVIMMLDNGYGLRTLLAAARGGRGRETDGDMELQNLARDYFLQGYAFSPGISHLAVGLAIGALIGFLGGLASWNPRSPFLFGEFVCVAVLGLLVLFKPRKSRQELLKTLAASHGGNHALQKRMSGILLDRPARWADVVTLAPSWVGIGFLLLPIARMAALDFPDLWQSLHSQSTLTIWILGLANLFSLPIFLGFSLIGLFPWPVGATVQSRYYPLLVLERDLNRKSG